MYSPAAGSSRWQPARWQSPSRSATSPPSEPDRAGDERAAPGRARAAARRRGRAPGRASRSRRSCAPPRRGRAAAGPRPPPPRRGPRGAAGTTSSPSARTSEVSTPAPARQRRRHEPAADAPEPHAHPVVGTERRGQPAREPGASRAGARPAPSPPARRAAASAKMLERQRGGDRIAGRAEHAACRPTPPSTTGWPGRTATPWTSSSPARSIDRGRVVVAAGARPGDHDHEVGARRRLPHRRLDPLRVVGHDRRRVAPRSPPRAPARRA